MTALPALGGGLCPIGAQFKKGGEDPAFHLEDDLPGFPLGDPLHAGFQRADIGDGLVVNGHDEIAGFQSHPAPPSRLR